MVKATKALRSMLSRISIELEAGALWFEAHSKEIVSFISHHSNLTISRQSVDA